MLSRISQDCSDDIQCSFNKSSIILMNLHCDETLMINWNICTNESLNH